MTSSPVDVSGVAADKLFGSAPVAPQDTQDAQDALHEPARSHQALAESVANPSGDRTDGLGADQENSSDDADASKSDQANMQPELTMPGEAHYGGSPEDKTTSSISEATEADGLAPQRNVKIMDTTSVHADETAHEVTTEPVITSMPAQYQTLPAPTSGLQNDSLQASDQQENAREADSLDAEQTLDEAQKRAHTSTDTEKEPSELERVAIDSFMSNHGSVQEQSQDPSRKPSTVHNDTDPSCPAQLVVAPTSESTSESEDHAAAGNDNDAKQATLLEAREKVHPAAADKDLEVTSDIQHAVCSILAHLTSGMLTSLLDLT